MHCYDSNYSINVPYNIMRLLSNNNRLYVRWLLQACKGMRSIYAQKVTLVPIKEMTDVLSVESKAVDLTRDTWVRMKTGTYKGDLAKVVQYSTLCVSMSKFDSLI